MVKRVGFFQVSGISRADEIRHRKALKFPMERTFLIFHFGKTRIILFIKFQEDCFVYKAGLFALTQQIR